MDLLLTFAKIYSEYSETLIENAKRSEKWISQVFGLEKILVLRLSGVKAMYIDKAVY